MRRIHRQLIVQCIVWPAFVGAASAADLPRSYPTKASPYVDRTYNWTGFYIGANVGYGWSSGTAQYTPGASSYTGDGDGILGGVQIGYNFQTGSWVFGLEADIQATGGDGTVTGNVGAATLTGTTKVPYFATARARIGYAFDRTLLYITGGGLYGRAELDGTVSTTGSFSSSTDFFTYTVGGGIEQAFWDRWSAKLEYLYAGTPSDAPVPPGSSLNDGSGHSHIVRAGINYRF